jgi:hypothetical protein
VIGDKKNMLSSQSRNTVTGNYNDPARQMKNGRLAFSELLIDFYM